MSDFSAGGRLDEADQIRSRLATLRDMERHLVYVSRTRRKALAITRQPLTVPSQRQPLTNPYRF
jgi:hypothetical protein